MSEAYTTTDIDIASTLIAAGHHLIGVEIPSNGGEPTYSFRNSQGLRAKVLAYASGDLTTLAPDLCRARQVLTSLTKGGR